MKIILCGPPHSGKSCLRDGLKEAIRSISGAPYPYFITACPDGEGAWYQRTVMLSVESANEAKILYKGPFTDEFVNRGATSVAACREPLTLIDIGGRIDEKNEKICAAATHAICLYKEETQLSEWRAFCRKLDLRILAEIVSDYPGEEDRVQGANEEGVLLGSIHHLERGEPIARRPMVKALAQRLVDLASLEMAKDESEGNRTMSPKESESAKANIGKLYRIAFYPPDEMKGMFGGSYENDAMVAELDAELSAAISEGTIKGGPYALKFDGPASLQIISVITHRLGHLFSALAFRDPKLYCEDPDGLEFLLFKGKPEEKTIRIKGRKEGDTVIPDPVFVVTVAHGPNFEVGQKLT